ncbi:uncharacterized protein LY89DRAFT_705840 [Mollisia scopiformis]|uniref:Wings apart-like protein C-terminal domain-containing protein n=1 Tax=Mollisia scopiformis TaxID=149040 RepID=A0A194XIT4_MOLSC|nr:uncharacterized protein LY89DRAFT_705840 [Mollisia scopiformis]KUJ20029.1 hypothetical protein LY89DRAFT_705840 [Mollisia scopiformis]
MATVRDLVPPRKKVTTYGKAARRRIPEYSFTSRKSQTPEIAKSPDSQVSASTTTTATPTKLKSVPRRSVSRTPSSASPPLDVFDVPLSDGETVVAVQRPIATPSKLKSIQSRSASSTPPSVPTKSADVYDVPTSDDEAPKRRTTPRPPKVVPKKSAAVKTAKEKAPPAVSKAISRPAVDVYDMPSDDDEARELKPKPIAHKAFSKLAFVHNKQEKGTHKTGADMVEEVGSRKRLKLSPAPDPPSPRRLPLPPNAIPRRPKPLVKPEASDRPTKPLRGRNTSPKAGQFTKVATAPKFEAPLKWPTHPATPRRPSKSRSKSNTPESSVPSPGLGDVDMMDADPEHRHISPKGLEMWQALLDPAEDEEMTIEGSIPIVEVTRDEPTKKKAPGLNLLSRPAGVVKASQKSPKKLPRRRLIDCLVEQAVQESEESSAEEDNGSSMDSAPSSSPAAAQSTSRGQSLVPEASKLPPITSDSQGSQPTGPKFTYSKQRSMLAEADLMAELAMDMPLPPIQSSQGRRGRMMPSIPLLKPLADFHDDEDEDDSTAAVKSVHEIRKQGANNRFLDETQDFLDRIGSPGETPVSMRRSGLFDLASKMKEKSFAEKFRANGMEQKLFLHLGQEADIVAGFIMVSLLTTVLLDGNMSHIVAQLRRQGITRLLIRLLECQSPIAVVAKDRKSNMSKVAQSLLIEHANDVMLMPSWDELKPQSLSPRTVALKCLEVMVRQTRDAGNDGEIFSKELTTTLFEILKTASDERSWDLPKNKQAIDFFLAVSALEAHSLAARTVQNETIWISDYLPIVADTLEVALSQPVEEFGMLQLLLFRLVLNVTNNNSKASDVFAKPTLISSMGQVIVAKFNRISRFLLEEELFVAVENLILLEGVMINFAEWSSAARESMQSLEGRSNDPLNAMVQIFADNQDKISEADSMQDTSKNVAFGYLSVLLGNFALLPAISERIQNRQPRKTLRPIVASIEEFIGHNKKVDMIVADEDGYNPQAGLTERLENLVNKLAELKVASK